MFFSSIPNSDCFSCSVSDRCHFWKQDSYFYVSVEGEPEVLTLNNLLAFGWFFFLISQSNPARIQTFPLLKPQFYWVHYVTNNWDTFQDNWWNYFTVSQLTWLPIYSEFHPYLFLFFSFYSHSRNKEPTLRVTEHRHLHCNLQLRDKSDIEAYLPNINSLGLGHASGSYIRVSQMLQSQEPDLSLYYFYEVLITFGSSSSYSILFCVVQLTVLSLTAYSSSEFMETFYHGTRQLTLSLIWKLERVTIRI